jgi:hypothetical protein
MTVATGEPGSPHTLAALLPTRPRPTPEENRMFFGKLLPKDGNFFELFNQHGQYIAEGARSFMSMVQY